MAIPLQQKIQRVQSAQRMEAVNNHEGAIKHYREMIAEEPTDPVLHYHLGLALTARLEFAEALQAVRAAIRLKDTVPEFFALQAIVYRGLNRLDDAFRAAERGVELDPKNISNMKILGDIYHVRGDIEEGLALLQPLFDEGCDHPQFLVVYAQLLSAADRREEARDVLERAVAKPDIDSQSAAWAHLHLGSVAEKLKDYETAWEHFTIGNKHRGTIYQPALHDAAITDTMMVWSKDRLDRLPHAKGKKSEQLVFILGMPRSGTSLVEQIIASHPEVYGGGELNFVTRTARELLLPTLKESTVLARAEGLTQSTIDRAAQKTQKLITAPSPRAKRFSDKLPQNFLHLGIIQLLFPRARVIQCIRDPRDICLSCYTRLFGGANSQPFSGNLEHLGHYFRAQERIMDHWHKTLDLPIFKAYYEDGVQDLETYARGLIDFLGLEWDDACLRFWETKRDVLTASTDQVRRPIYTTSIGRWRNFTEHLGPLFESLRLGPDDPWPREEG
ncbi:MAG: sulfotransferase [Planctomycetota bacterium]|nr:sulfotransferase [Planctomycetota bacterium]